MQQSNNPTIQQFNNSNNSTIPTIQQPDNSTIQQSNNQHNLPPLERIDNMLHIFLQKIIYGAE